MNKKKRLAAMLFITVAFMTAVIMEEREMGSLHKTNVEDIKLQAVGITDITTINAVDEKCIENTTATGKNVNGYRSTNIFKALETNGMICNINEPEYEYLEAAIGERSDTVKLVPAV